MNFAKARGPLKNKAYTVEPKQQLSSKWHRFCDLYKNVMVLTEL